MNLLVAYAIGGLLAYLWLCARSKESAESALGFLFSDPSALLIGSVFWPVVIPFLVIEGKIQAKEKNEKKNRIEYATDDLGVLEGKFGDTVTPQNPSGRVLVEGKEYESRSILAHIPKGSKIRVVGHSMRHLQIETAEPAGAINSEAVASPR